MEQDTQHNENSAEVKLDGDLSSKTIVSILLFVLLIVFGSIYFLFFTKKDGNQLSSVENVKIVEEDEATEIEIDRKLDTDQDGLPDYIEKILKTDFDRADTDGDSYSDFNEIKNGYNPLADEKYTEREWEAAKEKIRNEDNGFYGEMFGNIVSEEENSEVIEVLTFAGDLEYLGYELVSKMQSTTLLVTSDNLTNFEKELLGVGTSKDEVVIRRAIEVTEEELNSNDLMLSGNPDTNNLMAEIYEEVSVADIFDITDGVTNGIIKKTIKIADNPWNKNEKIIMSDNTYLMGGIISIKGKIKIEERGDYHRISLNNDDKIYALVWSNDYSGDNNILRYDGENVEISGYMRISNISKLQFEDSIGVVDIKIAE